MPLSFQIEPIAEWAPDAMLLWLDHWKELGLDQDLKVDPNIEQMKLLEAANMFSVITVRDQGKLAGYLLALISPHLHYKSSKPMLIVDAYYVCPEYRQGTGVRMLKRMEQLARERGCIKVYLSCKVHEDHSKLFTGLGYTLSDYAFIKRI